MPPPPSMGQSVRAALTKIHMHLPLIKGPLYGTVGGVFFFLLSRERAGGVKIAGFRYGTCFRYGERMSTRTRVSGLPGSFSPAAYSLSTTLPCPAILLLLLRGTFRAAYVLENCGRSHPSRGADAEPSHGKFPSIYILLGNFASGRPVSQPPAPVPTNKKKKKAYYVKETEEGRNGAL